MSDSDALDKPKTAAKRWTRRRFLKYAIGGGTLAAIGGATLDAFVIGPHHVEVTHPRIPIPNLPAGWQDARVAQLTDLHTGPLIDLDFIRRVVKMTNDREPDLIVATGDYVSDRRMIYGELAAVLSDLHAPLGKFAVLGNHDYWTRRPGDVAKMLQGAGFTMLTNDHVILRRGGDALCLAGVDDLWEAQQWLDRALEDVDDGVPRILLEHNPDYAEVMPDTPRVDFMICGHTHGGQFKIPFGPRPQLPIVHRKYGAGLVEGPCCTVYTSRGIGMVGIPVRFNCPPEIPVFSFTSTE